MKKIYMSPLTETTHVSLNINILAGSGIQQQGGVLKQDLGTNNVLGADDEGGDNLSKGGFWDD